MAMRTKKMTMPRQTMAILLRRSRRMAVRNGESDGFAQRLDLRNDRHTGARARADQGPGPRRPMPTYVPLPDSSNEYGPRCRTRRACNGGILPCARPGSQRDLNNMPHEIEAHQAAWGRG